MKKQTAAQIRAAQAVVDREEAIEAERERRRAERVLREEQVRLEMRAIKIAGVREAVLLVFNFIRYLIKKASPMIGILLSLYAFSAFFYSLALTDADLGQRWSFFIRIFSDSVGRIIGAVPYLTLWTLGAAGAGALVVVLIWLVVRFVALPLARLVIRKLRA
jgi:hypothetical protein